MSQPVEWGIIGPGGVGSDLVEQLGKDYVSERLGFQPLPSFVLRSSGMQVEPVEGMPTPGCMEDMETFPDVVYVAIPSYDDGQQATDYIKTILHRGSIAVTAEKGALANNFAELRDISDDFARLGVNATVGGGTRMLEIARTWCEDIGNISQIHLALNGTLSAIMSMVGPLQGSGMSVGQAVNQAVKLGYAEPGSESTHDVIRGEAQGDIPKKTSILFNKLGLAEDLLSPKQLGIELDDDQIDKALEEASARRFIVSLYSEASRDPESDIIGGFDIEHAGWRIGSGFRNINRNPLFGELGRITGPGSGIVVGLGPNESDGVYKMSGDGAGTAATANAMIDDSLRLLKR